MKVLFLIFIFCFHVMFLSLFFSFTCNWAVSFLYLYPPHFWFCFQKFSSVWSPVQKERPDLALSKFTGASLLQTLESSRKASCTHPLLPREKPSCFSGCSQILPWSSPLCTCWLFGRSDRRSSRHPLASLWFLLHQCWDHADCVTVGDLAPQMLKFVEEMLSSNFVVNVVHGNLVLLSNYFTCFSVGILRD